VVRAEAEAEVWIGHLCVYFALDGWSGFVGVLLSAESSAAEVLGEGLFDVLGLVEEV
jgi:hypothetical protein